MTDADKTGRSVALRDPIPWADLVEIVRTAEQTGYRSLFLPEVGARETPSALAGLATVTERIELATGVVSLASREVHTVAMLAATLQELSGGRFILGVGAGNELGIEEVRAAVSTIAALLAGEEKGGRALGLLADPVPDIWLAALGPRMTELAGEVADGVLLNWCDPARVERAREEIRRGAERSDRDPSAVTVAVYVRACVGVDEGMALEALGRAASMYAAMPYYRRQLDLAGLGSESEAAASGSGERLARALCAWGTRAEAEARLEAYRDAGADVVVVYPVAVRDVASSLFGTVLGLSPSPSLEP
ncbi:MAG TPA: LLM class flavin-dependent oxidoreductase [Actinomycetota bacterium]|nr:LLM class flavin-dependent oxidoreductase [Actinomycetota bacterium]